MNATDAAALDAGLGGTVTDRGPGPRSVTDHHVGPLAIVPHLEGQLSFDFGDGFTPPVPRFDVVLVVCHVCSGHHPVERCPQRRVCSVCSCDHDSSVHLAGVLPILRAVL